jgi:hypothetical protein
MFPPRQSRPIFLIWQTMVGISASRHWKCSEYGLNLLLVHSSLQIRRPPHVTSPRCRAANDFLYRVSGFRALPYASEFQAIMVYSAIRQTFGIFKNNAIARAKNARLSSSRSSFLPAFGAASRSYYPYPSARWRSHMHSQISQSVAVLGLDRQDYSAQERTMNALAD